ncbi:hypothetical protein B484DRAFT_336973 [Ochromonadaceae sp. CCMP2298]|nr:hypothetical protein B484DRAFT_336973 [Ochromonadaceae sp. CCMP2298]
MLYAICYMLYAICYMLYAIYYILYAICYMLYAICYMLYAICYMLYAICYMLYAIYAVYTPNHCMCCMCNVPLCITLYNMHLIVYSLTPIPPTPHLYPPIPTYILHLYPPLPLFLTHRDRPGAARAHRHRNRQGGGPALARHV